MNSNFAIYIRQRCNELGISLSELGRRANFSRRTLYDLLEGKQSQTRIATLMQLAKALQVHPIILFRQLLSEMPQFTTTGAKYAFDASGFVRDVSTPDNSIVTTGQVFSKEWEIQNCGALLWHKRRLVCVDKPVPNLNQADITPLTPLSYLLPTQNSIEIPDTPPGGTVILEVEFTAPAVPCTVLSYWKMLDELDDFCFPQSHGLYCQVTVVTI